MTFTAVVRVWPREGVLDPAGLAVCEALSGLGLPAREVRIGKVLRVTLEARDEEGARAAIEDACRRLLANPVLETWEVEELACAAPAG